jgi:hypothetical protein
MRNEKEVHDYMRKMAVQSATEWMDAAIASIESDLLELRRNRDRFVEATVEVRHGVTPVDAQSWFMNRLAQTGSNARMDLAVKHAAALAITQPKEVNSSN